MDKFWDERYAEKEFAYGEKPNEFFRQELLKLPPGRLLLPGEGEGRNAVFAASIGWEVIAFDQSEEGRKKALSLANQKGVNLKYQITSINDFENKPESFDCIALIFVHFSEAERKTIHQKLFSFLRPGGKIIMEVFSKSQLGRSSGGPKLPEMLYSEPELREDFLNLNALQITELEVELNEGKYHQGKAMLIRLLGEK